LSKKKAKQKKRRKERKELRFSATHNNEKVKKNEEITTREYLVQ